MYLIKKSTAIKIINTTTVIILNEELQRIEHENGRRSDKRNWTESQVTRSIQWDPAI